MSVTPIMGIRHKSLRQSADPWAITARKLFFHTTIAPTDRLLIDTKTTAYCKTTKSFPQFAGKQVNDCGPEEKVG